MWKIFMKKPKISLEVSVEEHAELVAESETKGISLSKVVRDRLFPEAPAKPAAKAQVIRRHPCTYNNPVTPTNFSSRDSQGTCMHRQQVGRPCFWAPSAAKNCNLYEAYVVIRTRPGALTTT